uniref:Ulp1+protease+family n=1 Tax=Oryza glaberrima TaxID=4538 RepID=G8JBB1_ORYGL|nr:ulp1+protease+family [Oryza glaberrima]
MGHRKRSKVDISSESNSGNDCSLSSDNHDGDVHLSNHDESSDNHRQKVESDSIIDDALLEIHNDLVLHSLKMKLSMLGEQSENKRKTFEKDNKCEEVFTRFNVKYFSKVINNLSVHDKEVIGRICFKSLLNFQSSFVPNQFASWIANHVDVSSSNIVVDDKVIPLIEDCVHIILGLPVGGIEISFNFELGKNKILETFGKSAMPSVKFFGDKFIKGEHMIDDQILISFMLVSLNCFLCPNSSLVPSNKYLSAFENIELIDNLNWSKLIFDWLMKHIRKLEKSKSLGGCFYCLAVNYLDYVNFGLRKLPLDIPRINVWKGNMIKEFSKFDKKSKGVYGRRPLKDISSTCYKMIDTVASSDDVPKKHNNTSFFEMVNSSIPNMLPVDIKNKIHGLLVHYFGNEDDMADERPKKLLVDVLALLADASKSNADTNLSCEVDKLSKSCNPTDQNNDEKNDVTSAHSPKDNMDNDIDDNRNANNKEEIDNVDVAKIMKLTKEGQEFVTPVNCNPDSNIPSCLAPNKAKSRIVGFNNREPVLSDDDFPKFQIWDPADDIDILNNEVTPVFDHNKKYIVPDSFSPIPAKQAI